MLQSVLLQVERGKRDQG